MKSERINKKIRKIRNFALSTTCRETNTRKCNIYVHKNLNLSICRKGIIESMEYQGFQFHSRSFFFTFLFFKLQVENVQESGGLG